MEDRNNGRPRKEKAAEEEKVPFSKEANFNLSWLYNAMLGRFTEEQHHQPIAIGSESQGVGNVILGAIPIKQFGPITFDHLTQLKNEGVAIVISANEAFETQRGEDKLLKTVTPEDYKKN